MAHTSMLHVRVDDELKADAAEKLASFGLTVSDAVRILLTRVTKEGGLPVGLTVDPEAHDAWFRDKVKAALADTRPAVRGRCRIHPGWWPRSTGSAAVPELEWLELARTDLLGIVDYISDDNPDAAQRVKDDIEMKAEKLPEFPKIGRPGRVEGTRELVVWSNYILVYQEDALTVRILRVLHAAQQWPPTD
jgi:toxin ParE1/3/4